MKGDVMHIRKSANLGDFHVEPVTIFTPPEPFTEVWVGIHLRAFECAPMVVNLD